MLGWCNRRTKRAGTQRRGGVRDIRADADHVEIERAECEKVFSKTFEGLAGYADHDAAACFVPKALEQPQDRQAVRPAGNAMGVNEAKEILV